MLSTVQASLAESTMNRDDDAASVLKWWAEYNQDGVHVFKCAVRCVMCIPAGSSLSETTFSHTTRDVTKLRNKLGDDTLEMLTVIQSFLIHGGDFNFEDFFAPIQALVDQFQKEQDEKDRANAERNQANE
jgi:hypothetical protein